MKARFAQAAALKRFQSWGVLSGTGAKARVSIAPNAALKGRSSNGSGYSNFGTVPLIHGAGAGSARIATGAAWAASACGLR